LETVGLRYFNVFGPRQDPASEYAAVIPRFILAALKDEPLEVHGDGLQSRDFTYVDNVVEFNLLAATAPGIAGEVFNVGTAKPATVLDIARKVIAISGATVRPKIAGTYRIGDIRHCVADISKITKQLGWQPQVSLEDGFRELYDWSRAQRADDRFDDAAKELEHYGLGRGG